MPNFNDVDVNNPQSVEAYRKSFEKGDYQLSTSEVNQIALSFIGKKNPDYLNNPTFKTSNGNFVNILACSDQTVKAGSGEDITTLDLVLRGALEQDTIQEQIFSILDNKKTSRFLIPLHVGAHYTLLKIDLNGENKECNVAIYDPYGNDKSDLVDSIKEQVKRSFHLADFEIKSSTTNTVPLQKHDSTSCGLIAARMIEEFCNENSFNGNGTTHDKAIIDKINNGKSYKEGALELREKYFQNIINVKKEIAANQPAPKIEEPPSEEPKAINTPKPAENEANKQKDKYNKIIEHSENKIAKLDREIGTNTSFKYGVKAAFICATLIFFVSPAAGILMGIIGAAIRHHLNKNGKELKLEKDNETEKLDKLLQEKKNIDEQEEKQSWKEQMALRKAELKNSRAPG